MEQIRKQIEEIIFNDDLTPIDHVDQIMQLIPTWKTFAADCKPEVGDWVAIRNWEGEFIESWTTWDANQLGHYISNGYQFFIIPKVENK